MSYRQLEIYIESLANYYKYKETNKIIYWKKHYQVMSLLNFNFEKESYLDKCLIHLKILMKQYRIEEKDFAFAHYEVLLGVFDQVCRSIDFWEEYLLTGERKPWERFLTPSLFGVGFYRMMELKPILEKELKEVALRSEKNISFAREYSPEKRIQESLIIYPELIFFKNFTGNLIKKLILEGKLLEEDWKQAS